MMPYGAYPMTRRDREAARLYREMVAAVRAWCHVVHPLADRLTLVSEDTAGFGETLAAFHAGANEWSEGDRLAMKGRN